ncbi:MAG: hypothetical protein A2521_01390 [Deltaproteobacteria bacterium RIFOXYD12_FULL_57_12]|nr:MAG: hypothetical protein A2521_01390 [Deltaproteobacteria bacterium RIFOXYD12_FULL_57_12]
MANKGATILTFCIMAAAVAVLIATRQWPRDAAQFPTGIALFVCGMAVINFLTSWPGNNKEHAGKTMDLQLAAEADPARADRNTITIFLWILGFLLCIFLCGFPLASLLFIFLYLRLEGREGWRVCVGMTATAGLFLYLLYMLALKTSFRSGWLLEWLRNYLAASN